MCTKCLADKPLTKANFNTYGPSRGLYYWERECNECRADQRHGLPRTGIVRKREVEQVVLDYQRVNGDIPAVEYVLGELNTDNNRVVRKYWDDLAGEGRVPARGLS
jgi:hypothetical protein